MDWIHLKEVFEALSYISITIALPLAWAEYRHARSAAEAEHKQVLQEQKYQTYHLLDEKYQEFLKLCFDNPDLDIFDVKDGNSSSSSLSPERRKQELIAFNILFATFERAFFTYQSQTDELRRRQWVGWDAYIDSFAKRENFSHAWAISGITFDEEFQNYMSHVLARNDPPFFGHVRELQKIANK
jgi:hypothetical protein